MAQGGEADRLEDQAQRHRWDSESVVADSSHTDQHGDDNRQGCEPGELAVDASKGAEPEEADKEE